MVNFSFYIVDRMKNRFKESVDYLKQNRRIYNASDLANITGKHKSYISEVMSGKRPLSEQFVRVFTEHFPEISMDWILTGSGQMLKGEIQSFTLQTDHEKNLRQIPVYEIEATAGFMALYKDLPPAPIDYITIPNLPPVDGAIYARGDSMSPLIESGDIIIFKKVELCPDNVLWGNIYIVSYTIEGDNYTVLKYLRHSSRDGYIRLESFNSRYDPQDIPIDSIKALALVKASITFHTIG